MRKERSFPRSQKGETIKLRGKIQLWLSDEKKPLK